MRIQIPFNGPAYQAESAFLSNQICRNFYLRPYPEMGERALALFGTPGFETWLDFGTNAEIRGMLEFNGVLYLVAGANLYSVSLGKAVTNLGVVGGMTGPIGMATNGLDVIVVHSSGGWVWDIGSSTFSTITDSDFPPCNNVVQVDGYYLVAKTGTGQIWRSDFNDGLSWDGLAFSTAGADPDSIISIIVSNRDVYTIGERSTEIWVNSGAATFNFVSIQGSYIQKGGVGPFAAAEGNNAVYWIGRDKDGQGQLIQSAGRLPKVVSTTAITKQIQSWGDLSDIQMFTYEQRGHTHVIITSPRANSTLVYDSTMGEWHERSSRVVGVDGRWRINWHSLFNNLHIVGDMNNGKLYSLREDLYSEDGEEIVSVRRSPISRDKQTQITINEIQFIFEPGVGIGSGADQDVDPSAIFRWSKDGGYSWTTSQISMGKIGEMENRAREFQLGQGRNWVFEIVISAAVKKVIKSVVAEAEKNG